MILRNIFLPFNYIEGKKTFLKIDPKINTNIILLIIYIKWNHISSSHTAITNFLLFIHTANEIVKTFLIPHHGWLKWYLQWDYGTTSLVPSITNSNKSILSLGELQNCVTLDRVTYLEYMLEVVTAGWEDDFMSSDTLIITNQSDINKFIIIL